MSIETTQTVNRAHAIWLLTNNKIAPIKKRIEFEFSQLSNKELEDLMDEQADEFTNYNVIDYGS